MCAAASPALTENFALGASSEAKIADLNYRAVCSLTALFDKETSLFRKSVTLVDGGLRWEAESRRSTLAALSGLHRLAESGADQPFEITHIEQAAFRDSSWVKSIADLGVLTWCAAVCGPRRLERVIDEFDFDHALSSFEDAREAQTEGIAWFLTGIAQAQRAQCCKIDLTDVAVETYRILLANQGSTGLFGHAGSARFPQRILQGRFGTVRDQMSAILALASFAKAFDVEEPMEAALACADTMRALQGERGEWWFLYDNKNSHVVRHYPVSSLCQCGVAASAMLALDEATDASLWPTVSRGISWATESTECQGDVANGCPFVWGTIDAPNAFRGCLQAILGLLSATRQVTPGRLTVRHEATSECLGLLLHAFGSFGLPGARLEAPAVRL